MLGSKFRGRAAGRGAPSSADRRREIDDAAHALLAADATAARTDGRHQRGLRRQQALVDAARELFISKGYRGTTLEAIIARAGGSRETIYRVFGGKHGLFGAIISQVGERLAQTLVEPAALSLPPRDALTRFALQLVAIWRSPEGQAMNRVVVSEGLDAPDLVDAWYEGGTKLSVAALSRYLEAQMRAGALKALEPELVARQFTMLLMGECAFPLISRTERLDAPAEQVARCVDLILCAYATS